MPELVRITRTATELVVGGAASLTALEESLAGEFPSLQKMLLVFASRPIRNRASLAGNLVTASPIGDMAPVLLSLDAEVRLVGPRGPRAVPLDAFFTAYRKTVLAPDEIVLEIVIPRPVAGARQIVDSYKVSKRRELDIAIVAAGFAIDLDARGVVTRARLGYGGVAPTPVRARQTEAFLAGKPWDEATVRAAQPILAGELSPIEDVRSGVTFRRDLIVSLFEKFWLRETSAGQDERLDFAASTPLPERTDDKGRSRALKHESAVGHVTGTAIYVDDQARRRPMLDMWPVTLEARARDDRAHRHDRGSRHARRRVHPDRRGRPGRERRRRDPQGRAAAGERRGPLSRAADRGRRRRQPRARARRPRRRSRSTYAPAAAILTIGQAIEAASYHTQPHVIRRGDCDAALRASPHTLAGEIAIGGQEHFYLEAQAAWAECGDDDDVFVYSSTQHPSEIQAVVSHVLHVPRNKVVVEAPRMGGGFGGKETQGNGWAALVALAALKTRRPVRVQLDRDIDMTVTGKRHPFFGRFEVGLRRRRPAARGARSTSCPTAAGRSISRSRSRPRAVPPRQLVLHPGVSLLGSRRADEQRLAHGVSWLRRAAGHGRDRGDHGSDRAPAVGLPPETSCASETSTRRGRDNTTHYGQELGDNRLPQSGAR